ncbi:peptidase S51, dipeptidase E [Shewanella sediminis HAW-EB3]|uniref:Peptidase S51, dipeptidase E n=1 Tax=Shewanella sediminis (strain HAW-EB3) TaxID=425104 RepID=A8FW83_SHESH|nr:Type 1 glutamine amidotransferase-like domain-containing protein [Shewanella sediminis]ABV37106.1 peptidase S51, dipeptidase E [Shewanella sediminis HAW-EB3]
MKLALVSDHSSVNGMATIRCVLNALSSDMTRVAYIASQPDPDRIYYRATQAIYRELGADLSNHVELESDFDESAVASMFGFDAIHLSGGDTFRFLKWLKKRDLLTSLQAYLNDGGAIIGVSAGAMIMTPSIESARLCGDTNDVDLQDLSSLSLVPFQFVPHVDGDIKDASMLLNQLMDEHSDAVRPNTMPWTVALRNLVNEYYLCPDDAGIAVIDDKIIEFGQPVIYRPNS